MTDEDLDRLEALAKAATPGPWHRQDTQHPVAGKRYVCRMSESWKGGGDVAVMCDDGAAETSGHGRAFRDAVFIAATNPAVVLALRPR